MSSRQYSTVAYSTTTSSSTAAAGQYSTASPVQYKPVSGVQPYSARHNVAFDKYSCAHCRYITTRIGDLKKHMATEHPKVSLAYDNQTFTFRVVSPNLCPISGVIIYISRSDKEYGTACIQLILFNFN